MKDDIRDMLHKLATGGLLSGSCDTDKAVDKAIDCISQNYIPKERVLTKKEIVDISKSYVLARQFSVASAGEATERLADALLKAGSIEKVGVKDIETQEKKAINWLKVRVGKLMGCTLVKRDEVYKIAIRALENQQAMKDGAKPLNNLKEKE